MANRSPCPYPLPPSSQVEVLSFAYYVYYRVSQPARARLCVQQIQTAVKERTGIDGRVLAKRDDPATWMEIYEGVKEADAFERCLAASAHGSDFASVLAAGSERHVECFEEPCA